VQDFFWGVFTVADNSIHDRIQRLEDLFEERFGNKEATVELDKPVQQELPPVDTGNEGGNS
jgi:CRISPR/Cas system type I-B associated protein Csh2 (Cas7 group RAMP superfamily)